MANPETLDLSPDISPDLSETVEVSKTTMGYFNFASALVKEFSLDFLLGLEYEDDVDLLITSLACNVSGRKKDELGELLKIRGPMSLVIKRMFKNRIDGISKDLNDSEYELLDYLSEQRENLRSMGLAKRAGEIELAAKELIKEAINSSNTYGVEIQHDMIPDWAMKWRIILNP